jgi:cobalt-precorrin-5B (C1)-methyltransferase
MRDPVTGFEYPDAWVRNCTTPDSLPLVELGLAVLTASGTVLMRGYTTGTTAAAACKAAVISLSGAVNSVPVLLPCGITVDVPVFGFAGHARCKKFAGDYPGDVTAEIEMFADATPLPDGGIEFLPGIGIGRFSRNTPRFLTGDPAITPSPLSCIQRSIQEAVDQMGLRGARVALSIPKGVEIAKKTLNSHIGVLGGISILGTTGFVEPWDDHLTESVLSRIVSANDPVITTGRTGLRFSRLHFPGREVILVGGKLGESLAAAQGPVTLSGLPGLILRFIEPHILDGTGHGTVEELSASPEFSSIFKKTMNKFRRDYPSVRVILFNREGSVIGESP